MWPKASNDSAVILAVGNFDGVHLGHLSLLERALDLGRSEQAAVHVLTFKPHPSQVLGRENFCLVQDYSTRRELLLGAGVHRVLEVEFSQEFSKMKPQEFCDEVVKRYQPRTVVVGFDFRFGQGASANALSLKDMLWRYGVNCEVLERVDRDGEKVSSSQLRRALSQADLQGFYSLCGREYRLTGQIVSGAGQGRKLGFPTLNLQVPPIALRFGVYLVKCYIHDRDYSGIANYGRAPTIQVSRSPLLEIHFPDQAPDCHESEFVCARFYRAIRPEIAFSSAQELKNQIHQDLLTFKDWTRQEHAV